MISLIGMVKVVDEDLPTLSWEKLSKVSNTIYKYDVLTQPYQ